jgi:hypothetical protein
MSNAANLNNNFCMVNYIFIEKVNYIFEFNMRWAIEFMNKKYPEANPHLCLSAGLKSVVIRISNNMALLC